MYLDHNASAPVTPELAQEMLAFMDGFWGNAGAQHPDGIAARDAIESARQRVATAIGGEADEVTFTSGGTESNNWALFGIVNAAPKGRRHLVVGRHEHLSVVRTVEELERRGVEVTWLDPAPGGALRPAELEAAVRGDTLLVTLMLANNETGILQPVEEAARIAARRGALLFVDAVCGAGKIPLDVRTIGCDLLSVSGHKVHAPKGVGALWVKAGTDIAPLVFGCGQQRGLRSGTENTMGAVALGAAMERHVAAGRMLTGEARALRDGLWQGIEQLGVGAVRNGSGADLPNTLSVWFPGWDALQLQGRLGAAGLSVSAQCGPPRAPGALPTPSHVLVAMGMDEVRARESLRFSLGSTTVLAEIATALDILAAVIRSQSSSFARSAPMTDLHLDSSSESSAGLRAGLLRPERDVDCSLDRLTEALAPLLEGGGGGAGDGAQVAALLREYAAAEESWRRYTNFQGERYTRNLIWRCGDFELLLLCWDEGQESPIHDHAGQQCWMAVLEGEFEEVHYSTQGGELQPGRVMGFGAGGVAFIHDDIALHLIRPKAGSRCASLHLYASPIDTCEIHCAETGQTETIRVGYDSVRGTACDGADPELIRVAWGA